MTNDDVENYKHSLKAVVTHITRNHPELFSDVVDQVRALVSDYVKDHHKNTVAYGPFKGLRLSDDAHWGMSDHGTMVLGIYEQEILNELSDISPRRKTFINLGAGDGYYPLGMLVAGLCERSYCFEISELGCAIIAKSAVANGVQDRVAVVVGEAKPDFYKSIPRDELSDSVVLVDIEGAEFDIMTDDVFAAFGKSILIIEIHEFVDDIVQKYNRLKRASAATHTARKITTASRDMSVFPELAKLTDNNRWLLCSERRPHLMSWLRFDPIAP